MSRIYGNMLPGAPTHRETSSPTPSPLTAMLCVSRSMEQESPSLLRGSGPGYSADRKETKVCTETKGGGGKFELQSTLAGGAKGPGYGRPGYIAQPSAGDENRPTVASQW